MRSRRIEEGAVAVEFAILLIPLLTIVLLIVDYSTVMFDKSVITNASREAARAAIIVRKSPARLTDKQVTDIAQAQCDALLISYSSLQKAVVTVTPAASRPNFGDEVTVTVKYTFSGFVLGGAMRALGTMGNLELASQTTMRNE